jgi:CxxC motif-containing protein (DUF1111 family)
LVYAVTPPEEAPALSADDGFVLKTNGLEPQDQFNADRLIFSDPDKKGTGLGPVYNALACVDCHQNPVTGAGSQVTESRVGRFDGTTFTDRPGGSLINDRAINSNIQELVAPEDNVRALRLSLSTLGDGYIEAIPDSAITDIQAAQPAALRGKINMAQILEDPGTTRIGRFGWKAQHASLLSFSADAYLNEVGITSPLFPNENTSNGSSVLAYDDVVDPEDANSEDILAFTRFMRSTKVPSSVTPTAGNGGYVFITTGCATCHTPTFVTADPGTVLHSQYTVPTALGAKIIHPYSDFMLHDIGTGDGIQLGNKTFTRNRIRTPPLWGLRARGRLMHDGATLTKEEAILRHSGEASSVIDDYSQLSPTDKAKLLAFLSSL